MSPQKLVVLLLKVIALSVLWWVCFMVGGRISGVDRPQAGARSEAQTDIVAPSSVECPARPPTEPTSSPGGRAPAQGVDAVKAVRLLLLACSLQAVIFSYLILRSRWAGWKLVGTIFLTIFGVIALHTGLESAVYLSYLSRILPTGMTARIFLMLVVAGAIFSPLAVLIMGKMKRDSRDESPNLRLLMPASEWLWKSLAIAVAYLVVYYTFGYFVAWRSPAVRQFYGATELRSFFQQIGLVWSATPWMFPFQAFRGLLYMVFALPIVRMLKGRSWEAGLAIALMLSVLGGAQLLVPNPFMPESVSRVHLIEVMSSNFIFGWLVGWLLGRSHVPAHSPREEALRPAP